MNNELKNKGFSLTEVLLSMGILAVGMLFIAGVFPVGIYFATVATERTTAAVVAEEAFAKIRLYGVYPAWLEIAPFNICYDVNDVSPVGLVAYQYEYYYPSTSVAPTHTWTALCRRLGQRDVQVTVFVCRTLGPRSQYWFRYRWDHPMANVLIPHGIAAPVFVNVSQPFGLNQDELFIDLIVPIEENFINDGYTIVDNETGRIYRVLQRYADNPDTPQTENRIILLDRDFEPGPAFVANLGRGRVWVIPPPVDGSRNPCVGVYQKVIRF